MGYCPVHIVNNIRGLLISVHISDIHFTAFDPKDQYRILQEQFLEKIVSMSRIDIISVNGDLFDHKIMSSSDGALYASMFVADLVEIAKMKNATLILIHGTASHDADQLKLFYHYLNDPTVDIKIVTDIQFVYTKNAKILCIPELYNIDESVYQYYLFNNGNYDAVFMHGTIEGAGISTGNGRLFSMNDFIYCRGPIVSGHIHKPCNLYKYFYYTGSPYPWRFDDDHQKGFMVLLQNLDTRWHYMHFQHIYSYKYETIDINIIESEDPRIIINYIDNLKIQQGIDFIRVRFNIPVPLHYRTMVNNNYRNNKYVNLEFTDTTIDNTNNNRSSEFDFLLENKSEEQHFVEYCNYMEKNDTFISIEKLKEILSSDI